MISIRAEFRPVLDAILMGLDPRLSEEERDACLLAAVADAPEFVAGVLASLVDENHRRTERLRGWPPGTLVDRMRSEYLGAKEPVRIELPASPLRDGDLRRLDGGQLQEWGDGLWHDVPEPPSAQRTGSGPNGEWTVADAAIAAEQARRARQAAALGLTGALVGGRDQTGVEAVSEPLRAPSEDSAGYAFEDPRVAPLLERLQQQRSDEAAIDQADLDRPETMPAAMTAALDPVQLDIEDGTSHGGNSRQYEECGIQTPTGPCVLRSGHPELPVPGTDNGHMSKETLR